ncbi:ABC-2 type transport system permease protein [Neobacillus bataviensis]|uniref:ABC-2 type transport system permease protein n=1 Tax=Neobacillus bataviensis TaxID=220685 RepID=A0A561D5D8_9BACI|nr:ABC transporter permease [Neobacillus bataviensis]TWD98673.1 ABC-2 type transport system permease protein [Neobacillus bataviensis]
MNIINIALNEFKRNIRDIRTLVFMLAFPIVLMLILGTALSNTFDKNIKIGKINVLYTEKNDSSFSAPFQSFIEEAKKQDIHFSKASERTDGKRAVKQNHYDAYVEVTDKGIQFYGSERNSIQASMVEGMLTAFTDKYNLITEVAKEKPEQVQAVLASTSSDYVKEASLNADKAPGSMDYYAMAMTTMIALYSAISASSLIRGERRRNTAIRLAIAPINKMEIFLGKILGGIGINFVCILLVMAFSRFAFGANWGSHPGMVVLLLFTLVFLAVSFGLGLSYIIKTDQGMQTIVMIVLQLAAFFGGAYFRIDNADGFLKLMTNLSPLTWARDALTKIIYNNDLMAALPSISLNIGIAIIFLLIAIVAFRKREGL